MQQCYLKERSIVSRKIADEYVLVPLAQKAEDLQSIYALRDVAARIWELLEPDRTAAQILQVIEQEFEVAPAQAQQDLSEFLQQLEQTGAIRRV